MERTKRTKKNSNMEKYDKDNFPLLKTTLYTYYLDTRNENEAVVYKQLKERMQAQGVKCFKTWGQGSHWLGTELCGTEIELETSCLFDNQWNTAPFGKYKTGLRVFDWAQDYLVNTSKFIKKGHYLELTDAMKEVRANTVACGYCGKQEPAQKGNVFCAKCLDSEYLKEKDLHLLRMRAIDNQEDRGPLTQAEKEHLLPLYKHAQLHGCTKRGTARLIKQRQDIEHKCKTDKKNAQTERDGLIWLLDHGVNIDNVIFYNHTGRFGFGWRQPVEPAIKSDLETILREFPFDYDIK